MNSLSRWTRRCSILLAAVTGLSIPACTQEFAGTPTRSVQGTITDGAGRPMAGVTVELRNMRDMNVRSFITTEDGKYHFDDLYTNLDYRLRVRYQGAFGPSKSLSRFNTAPNATVNLRVR